MRRWEVGTSAHLLPFLPSLLPAALRTRVKCEGATADGTWGRRIIPDSACLRVTANVEYIRRLRNRHSYQALQVTIPVVQEEQTDCPVRPHVGECSPCGVAAITACA